MGNNGRDEGQTLISGGSGMLGASIGKALIQQGSRLLRLVRRDPREPNELRWNPSLHTEDTQQATLEIASEIERRGGIQAAVHLSGANVSSRRWSAAYKREMTESRVDTTRFLSDVLSRLKEPPSVLVAASAVGFYGDRGDAILDENSVAGVGFFPELCSAWEGATTQAEGAGIRVVHLRFGVVLGPDGGALARLAPMFKLGLGGKLGSGRQWMSWISEADAVGAVLFALRDAGLSGALNAVAPVPVTNADFTTALGREVHRPTLATAPGFALRLIFGEMADEALLASTRAVPKRLLDAGFHFRYPEIGGAFAAALSHSPGRFR